jgi:hypothetical protein
LGFRLGWLREDIQEELFVETRQFAVGSDREQLVGQIHEHAVVASGVVRESDTQLTGHQRLVTGHVQEMVETSE